ncbi:hypothetical protein HDU97_009245 [Phlyctochytrium planicorne]|nr:hypothetical protein HDU97_009245 [Phlyctochytrium planicorne]
MPVVNCQLGQVSEDPKEPCVKFGPFKLRSTLGSDGGAPSTLPNLSTTAYFEQRRKGLRDADEMSPPATTTKKPFMEAGSLGGALVKNAIKSSWTAPSSLGASFMDSQNADEYISKPETGSKAPLRQYQHLSTTPLKRKEPQEGHEPTSSTSKKHTQAVDAKKTHRTLGLTFEDDEESTDVEDGKVSKDPKKAVVIPASASTPPFVSKLPTPKPTERKNKGKGKADAFLSETDTELETEEPMKKNKKAPATAKVVKAPAGDKSRRHTIGGSKSVKPKSGHFGREDDDELTEPEDAGKDSSHKKGFGGRGNSSKRAGGWTNEEDLTEARKTLLKGVTFTISGIQNPERDRVRKTAISMGAYYNPDWTSKCRLLICPFKDTPKIREAKASINSATEGGRRPKEGSVISAVIVVPEFLDKTFEEGRVCEDPRYITWSGGAGPAAGLRMRLGLPVEPELMKTTSASSAGSNFEERSSSNLGRKNPAALKRSQSVVVPASKLNLDEDTDVDEEDSVPISKSAPTKSPHFGRSSTTLSTMSSSSEKSRPPTPRRAFSTAVKIGHFETDDEDKPAASNASSSNSATVGRKLKSPSPEDTNSIRIPVRNLQDVLEIATPPLEPYLDGVSVYFDPDMSTKTYSVLYRYVIAGKGNAADNIETATIACTEKTSDAISAMREMLSRSERSDGTGLESFGGIIVGADWLVACINSKSLVDTSPYEL